jgi:hypothetical protein
MAAVRPVIQYDLNRDVHTAQEMASRLVPFVYENETFGYMPDDLPKLTIGGLLMRLHRLSLLGKLLSSEQQEQLEIAQQQVDSVKQEWLVAYTNKTTQELVLRVNEWNQCLNDCGQDQYECHERYPSMVEKRVIAQLLTNEARQLKALVPFLEKRLIEIDYQLQGFFKPGSFIWDQRLQQAYPQDQYGFLYVTT